MAGTATQIGPRHQSSTSMEVSSRPNTTRMPRQTDSRQAAGHRTVQRIGLQCSTCPGLAPQSRRLSDFDHRSCPGHLSRRPPSRMISPFPLRRRTMAAASVRIGFLGAGRMASALAKGWLHAGLVAPDRVSASDPIPAAREAFAKDTAAFVSGNNHEIVTRSDLLVLAVKPQNMAALLADIKPVVTAKHLVVSIAAGV